MAQHVQKNFIWLLNQLGTNVNRVAHASGMPQPTLRRLLTGASKDPRTETVTALAAHFGLSPQELRDHDLEAEFSKGKRILPESDETLESGAVNSQKRKKYQKLSQYKVEAGLLPASKEPFISQGSGTILVTATVEEDKEGHLVSVRHAGGSEGKRISFFTPDTESYALRVGDDSLRPRYRDGEFIVVEPNRTLNLLDEVLITYPNGKRAIKELLFRRSGCLTLGSITAQTDSAPVVVAIKDLASIHVITAKLARNIVVF